MPYVLSPLLTPRMSGMWFEGLPFEKKEIYSIQPGKMPPVNYDSHVLKPHSLPHAEGALHVLSDGKSIDQYFADPKYFFGSCLVIRLSGNSYKKIDEKNNLYYWEVGEEEIRKKIEGLLQRSPGPCEKVLLTTDFYPVNADGFHDPNYVLTLSPEAAQYLVQLPGFNLYGTSWKSSDHRPGSPERPIHKILLSKAIIFELLDLRHVPEGRYFFSGFPLRLEGASESAVCPVLYEKHDIRFS